MQFMIGYDYLTQVLQVLGRAPPWWTTASLHQTTSPSMPLAPPACILRAPAQGSSANAVAHHDRLPRTPTGRRHYKPGRLELRGLFFVV